VGREILPHGPKTEAENIDAFPRTRKPLLVFATHRSPARWEGMTESELDQIPSLLLCDSLSGCVQIRNVADDPDSCHGRAHLRKGRYSAHCHQKTDEQQNQMAPQIARIRYERILNPLHVSDPS